MSTIESYYRLQKIASEYSEDPINWHYINMLIIAVKLFRV